MRSIVALTVASVRKRAGRRSEGLPTRPLATATGVPEMQLMQMQIDAEQNQRPEKDRQQRGQHEFQQATVM